MGEKPTRPWARSGIRRTEGLAPPLASSSSYDPPIPFAAHGRVLRFPGNHETTSRSNTTASDLRLPCRRKPALSSLCCFRPTLSRLWAVCAVGSSRRRPGCAGWNRRTPCDPGLPGRRGPHRPSRPVSPGDRGHRAVRTASPGGPGPWCLSRVGPDPLGRSVRRGPDAARVASGHALLGDA